MSAAAGGLPIATLESGRRIFATQCTACHNASPVGKYSAVQWRKIVAVMSLRAKLNAGQEQALLAYLVAARETSAVAR